MEEGLEEVLRYVEKRIEEVEKELGMLRLLKQFLEEKMWKAVPKVEEVALQEPARRGEGALAAAIESARWRTYRSGQGEWCFADELPREFVDRLRSGPVEFRGHTYLYKKLSGGKEIVARK